MTEEQEDLLDKLSEQGNEEMENGNYPKAIACFSRALETIPAPKEDWEAAGWLYASIGDACFMTDAYKEALDNFRQAYKIYGTEAMNPFILLRIGQCHYHLREKEAALDFLLRAYMMEGEDIFEDAVLYFDFLRENVEL